MMLPKNYFKRRFDSLVKFVLFIIDVNYCNKHYFKKKDTPDGNFYFYIWFEKRVSLPINYIGAILILRNANFGKNDL